VVALFDDPDFQEWVKMLAAGRHFVAHRGVALPQIILLRDHEVSTEELDRKIEQMPEWQRMVGMLGKESMEEFRATWRYRMLREEYETLAEPGFEVELDGRKVKVLIFPLVSVEWDFAKVLPLRRECRRGKPGRPWPWVVTLFRHLRQKRPCSRTTPFVNPELSAFV
jgi:hypothetical protein